ncbi:MAG: SDR family oxidoreductase [Burkholderiaceae bacterium]
MNDTAAAAPLVFITGASSGIGQALAERYAKDGWRLALVARRGEVLHDWVRAQGLGPERASVHVADVADIESITAAGRTCIDTQGLPDVVIANAGISIGMDSAQREDLDVMVRTFATNSVGVAATFHPFIEPMARRGRGTLVGIASVAGIRGMPGHGAYCASKAAVISYCESLRAELRALGVKVVTISPGYIATPLTRRNRYPMPFLMAPADFAARAVRAIAAGVPHRVIPWPMAAIAMLLRVLPAAWLDRLLAGRPRKHRQGET